MFISELFQPINPAYHDDKEDSTSVKMSDTRKTRLSLLQINKLRIMNDVRKFEHEKKLGSITKQYALPASAEAGGLAM